MDQREKIEAAVRDLRDRGVGAFTAAPPMFRWLWRFGVNLPPPFFLSFGRAFAIFGGGFAVLWPAVNWLIRGGQLPGPPALEAATALVAGALFGLLMAGYFRLRARRLRLPDWESYAPRAA